MDQSQQLSSLLDYYNAGHFIDAEKLALSIIEQFPEHQFAWKVLGAVLQQNGRLADSLVASQKSVACRPQDAEAHNNLGNIFKALDRLDEAEASYRKATILKPDFSQAYNNLANMLKELGRSEDAEVAYRQVIILNPNFPDIYKNLANTLRQNVKLDEAEAIYKQAVALKFDCAETHFNLGATLKDLEKLQEAEVSYSQAITLKPDYVEAHNNLGNMLAELGRLGEAEAAYRQAISFKADCVDAYNNLGTTLKELDRLEEAETSCRKAIAINSDYARAHASLGLVLHAKGEIDSAIASLKKAHELDRTLKSNELVLKTLLAKKLRENTENDVSFKNVSTNNTCLASNPLIFNREVETTLTSSLDEMASSSLDRAPGPRYGNGRCSPNYKLFDQDHVIIKAVANDLIRIMEDTTKSEVYVYDSFFNVFGNGGGITPHTHLNSIDKDKYLNLGKQKYSLIYYISVGDQNCREPGFLKFYDPKEQILPCEGMIIIFPAGRPHSAMYGGNTDRILIGANFYSL